MKKTVFLVLLLFCINYGHTQQVNNDMQAIHTHICNEQALQANTGKKKVKMQTSLNPIKLVLFVPLFIYQKFISEQISATCEFEPSCSNFGVQSLKVLGLLKGLFLTADRLMRCNGQAQPEAQYYLIDHYTGKVIDEPSMYKIKD